MPAELGKVALKGDFVTNFVISDRPILEILLRNNPINATHIFHLHLDRQHGTLPFCQFWWCLGLCGTQEVEEVQKNYMIKHIWPSHALFSSHMSTLTEKDAGGVGSSVDFWSLSSKKKVFVMSLNGVTIFRKSQGNKIRLLWPEAIIASLVHIQKVIPDLQPPKKSPLF